MDLFEYLKWHHLNFGHVTGIDHKRLMRRNGDMHGVCLDRGIADDVASFDILRASKCRIVSTIYYVLIL